VVIMLFGRQQIGDIYGRGIEVGMR
jgi:hypothetical protein